MMFSFMLEGEPHLNVVDRKKDIGKTRKLQVCSACVCACVRMCMCGHVGVVTGCVHMCNMSPLTQYSLLARPCSSYMHTLFALFTIAQGCPQMLYVLGTK